MTAIAITYICYLLISILLTIWVARTLHKGGRIFLVDTFAGNENLADSINHLLVVGFYLINFGFVCLALKTGLQPEGLAGVLEVLSSKVGLVLVVLGVLHFMNRYIFTRMRRRAMLLKTPPPLPPSGRVAVAGVE